jgi:murein L,D-transpeptidase YcbB/YkuD
MIFGSPVSSPGVIVTPAVPAIVAGNGPVYAQYGQVNVQPGSASLSKNTIVNITTPTTITSKNVANTSVSVATSTSTQSKAFQFTKDLRYGMTSSNVKKLQQFLNSHGFVVSKKGIGSFGKETNYFGLATQLALMKFQNFYKKDILVPQGLKKPNGIMGHATRKVINSMIQ